MSLYNRSLHQYWEWVITLGLETEVTEILKIKDLDERYRKLKKCFDKIDPKMIDDRFVWNLYKETL